MEQDYLIIIAILWVAYFLDLLLGDPRNLPHPIRWYGHSISFGEKILNKGSYRILKGAFLTILLLITVYTILTFSLKKLEDYPIIYFITSCILLFYALANKSLIQEGEEVFKALDKSVEEGRARLSWIVGRDTSQLNPHQIRTATFETLSENLSDGVIAPLFYFALLGVPGALCYKMVNTLDSMIGYKNEKYFYFGKFAAKLDDVVNYIPARLTAILMLLVSLKWKGIPFVFSEGKKHSSPNAGYPEAALAYILDCQFGGPNIYHGKVVDKPYIGSNPRILRQEEFTKVATVNHKTTLLMLSLITAIIILNNYI